MRKMPEVKFLNEHRDEPYLYLDELHLNRDRIRGPVYVVPDPIDWKDPHRQQSHRTPNPLRSKRSSADDDERPPPSYASLKEGSRVTIRLPHNDSKGNDSIKTSSKSILGSPVSGIHKDDIDIEKAAPTGDGKPGNICKRLMGGCSNRLTCCGARKQNQSKVHLIDEKGDPKKKMQKMEAKPSKMSRLNCCGKKPDADAEMVNISNSKVRLSSDRIPNDKMDDKQAKSGCLGCCSRKNKIRDSSADRRNSMTKAKWYDKMICCKSKKQKRQDWAARRDSILSEPAPRDKGCCSRLFCCRKKKPAPMEDNRRMSLFSKKRSLSQAVPVEDSRSKLDPTLIEHGSHIRAAIPALPVPLAWICFACNIVVPGLGTLLSGIFCLCFGRPRFGVYDGYRPRIGAFIIDVFVGVGQLFTVLFCLVGWGWSIWWGSMMVKVARKYKKFRIAAEDPERAAATTNNHRAAARA